MENKKDENNKVKSKKQTSITVSVATRDMMYSFGKYTSELLHKPEMTLSNEEVLNAIFDLAEYGLKHKQEEKQNARNNTKDKTGN